MSFTKITEDLDIIQKLADEPNADDGLSAEEVKKKFDEAGNKIKSKFNKHIDELEGTLGASRVGANKIDGEDNSESNIQAKLEKIYGALKNVTLNQIPDGTITKEKINSTLFPVAEKNGDLQVNLNAEKLNGKMEAELYAENPAIGTYVATTANEMEINIGFRPRVVFVYDIDYAYYTSLNYHGEATYQGLGIITEYGCKTFVSDSKYREYSYTNTLTDKGFKVGRPLDSNGGTVNVYGLTRPNHKYVYVAFR